MEVYKEERCRRKRARRWGGSAWTARRCGHSHVCVGATVAGAFPSVWRWEMLGSAPLHPGASLAGGGEWNTALRHGRSQPAVIRRRKPAAFPSVHCWRPRNVSCEHRAEQAVCPHSPVWVTRQGTCREPAMQKALGTLRLSRSYRKHTLCRVPCSRRFCRAFSKVTARGESLTARTCSLRRQRHEQGQLAWSRGAPCPEEPAPGRWVLSDSLRGLHGGGSPFESLKPSCGCPTGAGQWESLL